MSDSLKHTYIIDPDSFESAGEASSKVKKMLKSIGADPKSIKKMAIALYEAEMNAFIHAGGGQINVTIRKDKVEVVIADNGPGIEDIDLAMQEGYSTAPDNIRQLGFGAGMGLPNMKRYADEFEISSKIGQGTRVTLTVYLDA